MAFLAVFPLLLNMGFMFLLKRLYGCTVWTGLGKFFILALFQVGGLGIMTYTVAFALPLGESLGMREKALMQDILSVKALGKIGRLLVTIIGVTFLAEILGTAPFNVILFEGTFRHCTVGLSLGLTPRLSSIGKCIMIMSMLVGRMGLLAFLLDLGRRGIGDKNAYPEENVMLGLGYTED